MVPRPRTRAVAPRHGPLVPLVATLVAAAVVAHGAATLLAGVPPRPADLTTVSGKLERVSAGCAQVRYNRCSDYFELYLAGQAAPYRVANHGSLEMGDLRTRLATGRVLTLLVRGAGERDHLRPDLDGWRDWDVWQIDQDNQRVVAYDAFVGAARYVNVAWTILAAVAGAVALGAGLLFLDAAGVRRAAAHSLISTRRQRTPARCRAAGSGSPPCPSRPDAKRLPVPICGAQKCAGSSKSARNVAVGCREPVTGSVPR